MSFSPTAGPVAVLKIGSVVVPGMNWKVTIDGKLANVSNFRDGRANAATLQDADVSFTVVWDAAAEPSDPAGLNLRPGVIFTGQYFTDSGRFFSVPAMISTVEPGVDSMEAVIMYPVTAKLQGVVSWPV